MLASLAALFDLHAAKPKRVDERGLHASNASHHSKKHRIHPKNGSTHHHHSEAVAAAAGMAAPPTPQGEAVSLPPSFSHGKSRRHRAVDATSQAPLPPRDVGVLVSIFHSSSAQDWANVARNMRIIRPIWSSIAIDGWGSPTSQLALRQKIHSENSAVLSLFTRIFFLATGSRLHVDHHARPSGSYKIHWLANFGNTGMNFDSSDAEHASVGMAGMEHLPALLIGLDADTLVPNELPLEAYLRIMASSRSAKNIDTRRNRAQRMWVQAKGDACAPEGPKRCLVEGPPSRVVYIHPIGIDRNVSRMHWHAKRATWALNQQRLGDCCGYFTYPVPLSYGLGIRPSFIRRGPHCPGTSFWIFHRRDLPLFIATLRVWHSATAWNPANQSNPNMRIEFLGCSLLELNEGVLIDVFHDSKSFV